MIWLTWRQFRTQTAVTVGGVVSMVVNVHETGVPSATALNTFVMALCRYMRHSIPKPVRCWAKLLNGIPRQSSSPS